MKETGRDGEDREVKRRREDNREHQLAQWLKTRGRKEGRGGDGNKEGERMKREDITGVERTDANGIQKQGHRSAEITKFLQGLGF